MFNFIKRVFIAKPIRKEIGGFEIGEGIVIGPMQFSKDGKSGSVLTCPPVWAFNYGITNVLNRLNKTSVDPEEFQSIFNSLLDDLVADTLIYLENRLRIITIKEKLKYKINSVPEGIKAYRNLASIDLDAICDTTFLKAIDRARGERHHSHKRYDSNYTIGTEIYETVVKLRDLASKARTEISNLDGKLSATHKDYDIKTTRLPLSVRVEWTAVNHAFDMTNGGKIVSKKPITGLDPSNIQYFSVQANFKK